MQISNQVFEAAHNIYGLFGPIAIMLISLVIISCIVGVKFFKAFESGIRLAIALTGISVIIQLLVQVYKPALILFIKTTGIHLSIIDVGWAPLATVTWGSPFTLFFLFVMVTVNMIMLHLHWTKTLDIDVFDIWHLAFTALMAMYFGANLIEATGLIVLIGILKIINSDLMKPTFNDLLGNRDNPMTSTHINYMMNPVLMVFNKIFDLLFCWLDKYDFNVTNLNEKIGFWGSNFAIGCYLGIFVGFGGQMNVEKIFILSFTGGIALQLFAEIGSWFIKAIDPLSQRIADLTNKYLKGRKLNVGLDWAFINGRSEIWATANILAPIMLIESLILPGNHLLPLGGIIAMGVTPALLIITQGRIIRMIVIGTIELPLFLWAGTLSAPFVTSAVSHLSVGGSMGGSAIIAASTKEGPIEQFLAYLVGKASNGSLSYVIGTILALIVYVLIFYWYSVQMKRRNANYMALRKRKNNNL